MYKVKMEKNIYKSGEWIPVEDGLPEDSEKLCLIITKFTYKDVLDYDVLIVRRKYNRWIDKDTDNSVIFDEDEEVIAWMYIEVPNFNKGEA